MDKLKMQVQLHVKGCWSIQKINLHVLTIHQTNVKILLEGESIIKNDYLDYHNHNFFGLKMNLKWKKIQHLNYQHLNYSCHNGI